MGFPAELLVTKGVEEHHEQHAASLSTECLLREALTTWHKPVLRLMVKFAGHKGMPGLTVSPGMFSPWLGQLPVVYVQ